MPTTPDVAAHHWALVSTLRRRLRWPLLAAGLSSVLTGVGPACADSHGFVLHLDQAVARAPRLDQLEAQPETPSRSSFRGGFPTGPLAADDVQTDAPSPLTDGLQQPPRASVRRAFPGRLLDDLPAAAAMPLHWDGGDWRRLGLGVLAVGAVSLVDEPVARWFDTHRNGGADDAARDIRPLGQEGGLILLGAAWLGGRYGHNTTLEAIGTDGLEASLITGLLVYPLKLAFGRERPRDSDDHASFWSGGESFPSGEAAQAFTVAAVVAAHSHRSWVRVTVWGLAGLVGLERMELDAHWASDVVAGALIGTAVGHWVVKHNRPDLESGLQVSVVPMIGAQHYGMAMNVGF